MIRVGTCICTYISVQNAALTAGSPPERLVEALSQTLQTNDSSEALSTLDNPALSTTLSIKNSPYTVELIRLITPYLFYNLVQSQLGAV